jgi:phosphate transport system substrate-binding protein
MCIKWIALPTVAMTLLASGIGLAGRAADKPVAKEVVPATGKLLISGSTTMAPMMLAVGKRFSELHPGVEIEVLTVGSGRGIDAVSRGTADIGMASRLLTDKDGPLNSFAIARDGICLVVHKNNPVQSLTNKQVGDVYTGRIKNWSGVGGRKASIVLVNPSEGLGAVDLFTHYFHIRYADIKARMVVDDNLGRIQAIRENPDAIAYLSIGTALNLADSGAPIRLLPVDGVAATTKNIRTGNFPISRPLLLLTKDLPTGLAKEFINFSMSSKISDLVLQHDFIPYAD